MISEHRRPEISRKVREAYEYAGLDLDRLNPGIVPLYKLIQAHPIGTVELLNMTPRTIADFFELETGQKFPIVGDAERSLAGYLYLQGYQNDVAAYILVEKNPRRSPIARRRFSAAHELGHYLLHFLPFLESDRFADFSEPFTITENLYTSKNSWEEENEEISGDLSGIESVLEFLGMTLEQMEEEANQFAAELLVPEKACRALARRYLGRFGKKREVLAGRLANEFLVSKSTMYLRLGELQLPETLEESIEKWA